MASFVAGAPLGLGGSSSLSRSSVNNSSASLLNLGMLIAGPLLLAVVMHACAYMYMAMKSCHC